MSQDRYKKISVWSAKAGKRVGYTITKSDYKDENEMNI